MTQTREAAFENNPDFSPIKLGGADGGRLQVAAECVEVLGRGGCPWRGGGLCCRR